MKKIFAILLVLVMVAAMMVSCLDSNDGPIVDGTPPTYGEENTPAKGTEADSQPSEEQSGGVIELPIDTFSK